MVSEFWKGNTTIIEQSKGNTHKAVVGKQFLRFNLGGETTALLPVNQMTEVLTIPVSLVVPIPHMPAWVIGVYNWRGEILWLVDLGHLIGLAPLYQQEITRSNYTAIVTHSAAQVTSKQRGGSQISGRKMLGLVVNGVEDMEWCDTNLIQSPPQSAVTPELVPFLRGYWMKPNGEMLIVLEGEAIISRMPNSEL